MRQAARKEIPTVVEWTQGQMLARIGSAPGPKWVPKWVWKRVKAYIIAQYKAIYVTVGAPKPEPKPAEKQAEAKAILESIEEPCPIHGVDHLDDNNECHGQSSIGDKCGWLPAAPPITTTTKLYSGK